MVKLRVRNQEERTMYYVHHKFFFIVWQAILSLAKATNLRKVALSFLSSTMSC